MKKLITMVLALLLACPVIHAETKKPAEVKPASIFKPDPVEPKVVELHIIKVRNIPDEEAPTKKKNQYEQREDHYVCSGGFIDEHGDILTAKHCTTGADSIEVVTADGQHYTATIVSESKVHDLAEIHIDTENTPHFVLAKSVAQGDDISTFGSPLAINGTQAWGKVAKLDGDRILLDISLLPGNSGGVVFNRDGELVGIGVAGFIVGLGVTHLNIAQSLGSVKGFLKTVSDIKKRD